MHYSQDNRFYGIYRLKIAALYINIDVPAVQEMMDTLGDETPELVVETVFSSSLDLIVC